LSGLLYERNYGGEVFDELVGYSVSLEKILRIVVRDPGPAAAVFPDESL
jgi:hypothetical protein